MEFFDRISDHFQPVSGGPGRLRAVYLKDGQGVGGITLEEDPAGVLLDLIIVGAKFRGRGIGSEMLRNLCELADRTGTDLLLSVLPSPLIDADRLCRFYERHGFALREDLSFGDDLVHFRPADVVLEPCA